MATERICDNCKKSMRNYAANEETLEFVTDQAETYRLRIYTQRTNGMVLELCEPCHGKLMVKLAKRLEINYKVEGE